MLTAIGVDRAPRVRSGDVEDEDALLLRDFDDLEAGGVEESRSARGLTADERGIEVGARLAIVVERLRPPLKRHVSRAWRPAQAGTDLPVALLILRRAETQSPFLRVEWHRAREGDDRRAGVSSHIYLMVNFWPLARRICVVAI